jgi:hypothetical protein
MVPIFSVYQIMFGSWKCEHLKVAYSFTTLVTWAVLGWKFTITSHSKQPQIFWHLQNFHMAGTPWPKIWIRIAFSSEATGSSFYFGLLLNCIVCNTYTAIHHCHGTKTILFARPLKQFEVNTLFDAIVQWPVLIWHIQLAVFECRHF